VTRYVVLLRAVNIGSNQIRMAELRAAYVEDGFADATTHIQTGNVLLTSRLAATTLATRSEKLITARFGLSITAIVRSAAELDALVRSNPYADAEPLTGRYVMFLDAEPDADGLDRLAAKAQPSVDYRVLGRDVCLSYREGFGRTKFTAALVEKQLGRRATARNWTVTTKLAELAAG